jgi:hypothetical protein
MLPSTSMFHVYKWCLFKLQIIHLKHVSEYSDYLTSSARKDTIILSLIVGEVKIVPIYSSLVVHCFEVSEADCGYMSSCTSSAEF